MYHGTNCDQFYLLVTVSLEIQEDVMRINNLGISENERVADINQITPNENKTRKQRKS